MMIVSSPWFDIILGSAFMVWGRSRSYMPFNKAVQTSSTVFK